MRIFGIGKIGQVYKGQTAKVGQSKIGKKDVVEFSTVAKDCQYASKIIRNVPDIRTDKVNAIKEQISTGTYNVDAEEVSRKIMSQFDMKG